MIALVAHDIQERLLYLDKHIRKSAATVYREAQVSARHAVGPVQLCRVNKYYEVCRSEVPEILTLAAGHLTKVPYTRCINMSNPCLCKRVRRSMLVIRFS